MVLGEQGLEAADVALDELGVERDGRERVFDLVSDAACDLFPGGLFLCAEKLGDVFEDEHVAEVLMRFSGVAFEEGDGGGDLERAGGRRHLHLVGGGAHAMRAAEEALDGVEDLGGEGLVEAQADELYLAAGIEEFGEGAVGEDDAEAGREGDDAVGDGFDDGLELGAALLQGGVELGELCGGLLGESAGGFEIGGHGVETGGEFAELFGGRWLRRGGRSRRRRLPPWLRRGIRRDA